MAEFDFMFESNSGNSTKTDLESTLGLNRNINDIFSLLESPNVSNEENKTQILKNVVAYVEVRTDNDNRSKAIEKELQNLGAEVAPKFTSEVTHVIYKDGKKATREKAIKRKIHLVSVLWLDSCKRNEEKMPEDLFPITRQEINGTPIVIPRFRKMKGKSMQPKDFEDEVASSAERGEKRRRRRALADRFKPVTSPQSGPAYRRLYVEETQPRSPFDPPMFSPNITIPDTPPSMREKLNLLRLKQKLIENGTETGLSPLVNGDQMSPLQRRLFALNDMDSDDSPVGSPTRKQESVMESPLCTQASQPPMMGDLDTPNLPSVSSSPSENITAVVPPRQPSPVLQTQEDRLKTVTPKPVAPKPKGRRRSSVLKQKDESTPVTTKAKPIAEKCLDLDKTAGVSSKRRRSSIIAKKDNNSPVSTKIQSSTDKRSVDQQDLPEDPTPKPKGRRRSSVLKQKDESTPVETSLDQQDMPEDPIPEKNVQSRRHSVARRKSENVKFDLLVKVTDDSRNSSVSHADKKRMAEECSSKPVVQQRRQSILKQNTKNMDALATETGDDKNSAPKGRKTQQKRKLWSVTDSSDPALELVQPTKASNTMQTKGVLYEPKKKNPRKPKSKKSDDEGLDSVRGKNKGEKRKFGHSDESDVSDSSKIDKKKARITYEENGKSTSDLEMGKQSRRKSVRLNSIPQVTIIQEEDAKPQTPTRSSRRKSVADMPPDDVMSKESKESDNTVKSRSQRRRSCVASLSQEVSKDTAISNNNEPENCSFKRPQRRGSVVAKLQEIPKETPDGIASKCPAELDTTAEESMIQAVKKRKKKAGSVTGKLKSQKYNDASQTKGAGLSSDSGMSDMEMSVDSTSQNSSVISIPNKRRSIDEFNMSAIRKKKTLAISLESTDADDSDVSHVEKVPKPKGLLKARSHSISCIASEMEDNTGDNMSRLDTKKPKRRRNKHSSSASESGSGSERGKKKASRQSSLSQAAKKGPKPDKSIVMTSLHFEEQDVVRAVVQKLGGYHLVNNVEKDTSHVVCGGNRRTLNVLYAIASGCWVISKEWVLKSLEAGRWLSEEPYEQADYFPAAQMSRLSRISSGSDTYRPDLFGECGMIYISDQTAPPQEHLMNFVTLCGGQVTQCVRKANLCVGASFRSDHLTVTEQWILDSITSHKCLPYRDYEVIDTRSKRSASPDF